MRVYAETNFLVELTLAQEEAAHCEEIISLCEAGAAELILPAFSLPEAYHALTGTHRQRVIFSNELVVQLDQFRRSATFSSAPEFKAVQRHLAESMQTESVRFVKYSDWSIANAKLIPLTLTVIQSSREWQNRSGLKLPDSVVLASVLADLVQSHSSDSCFITRDKDLSADPEVREKLRSLKCDIKPTFAAGVAYIRSRKS